jgi:hypothetical protein
MYAKRFDLFLYLIFSIIYVAGCSVSPKTASIPSSTPVQVTSTFEPTNASIATSTVRPSPTPYALPSPTTTQLPTATLPPTPDPALSQVKLIGLSWIKNYNLLLSFQFPDNVDPKNYRVTLEDKEYQCEVLAKYPKRLYCWGQGAKVLGTANVRVYQADNDQPGFEQVVWVPYFQ